MLRRRAAKDVELDFEPVVHFLVDRAELCAKLLGGDSLL